MHLPQQFKVKKKGVCYYYFLTNSKQPLEIHIHSSNVLN
jgi:hypothetical protein